MHNKKATDSLPKITM